MLPFALTAIATSVCVAIAAAFATGGGLTTGIAAFALIAGLAAGVGATARQRGTGLRSRRPGPFEWLVIAAFSLASLRAFFWLIYPVGDELKVLSPYNLGDISLHIGLIRYLASGVAFWPESQILAGDPIKYPLGADLFNSLLLLVGVPLREGLIWTGLGGAALAGFALWKWGRGFAIAALLFSGGLAGFVLFREGFASGQWQIRDFTYEAEWAWKNLFLTMLVTQRGLLFALPAGLLLLSDWRARWLRSPASPALPLWAGLLLYATMPLFSVHTFLFLSVTLIGVCVATRSPRDRRQVIVFVVAAVIPATVATGLVTDWFAVGGNVRWLPGWLQDDRPVWFWLRNFGVIPVLWIALLVLAIRSTDRLALAFVVPASVLFLSCAVISFAPWPWDNVKIMLWCWLAIAPFLWSYVLHPLTAVPRVALLVVLFFSGAVSLVGGLDSRHGYQLIRRSELDRAASALRSIPADGRFASAPDYAHPLILLGRPVAIGYEGHLWSHGLDYTGKAAALRRLMNQSPGWPRDAADLNVKYLYWGRPERLNFLGSRKLWNRLLPAKARHDDIAIYEIPPAPAAQP